MHAASSSQHLTAPSSTSQPAPICPPHPPEPEDDAAAALEDKADALPLGHAAVNGVGVRKVVGGVKGVVPKLVACRGEGQGRARFRNKKAGSEGKESRQGRSASSVAASPRYCWCTGRPAALPCSGHRPQAWLTLLGCRNDGLKVLHHLVSLLRLHALVVVPAVEVAPKLRGRGRGEGEGGQQTMRGGRPGLLPLAGSHPAAASTGTDTNATTPDHTAMAPMHTRHRHR
jgi:hypothetical protein